MINNSSGNREPRQEEKFTESSYEYSDASVVEEPAAGSAAHTRPRAAAPQDLDASAAEAEGENAEKKTKKGKKWSSRIPNPAAKVQAIAVALSGPDSQRITLYMFLPVGLLHLLFVILSSVLSQLDEAGGGCFTYWGYKASCDSTSYTLRASLMQGCPRLRSMLQAGAAFSIFSILSSCSVVCMGWILCSRMRHVIRLNRRRARYSRHAESDALIEAPADTDHADGAPQAQQGRKAAGTQFHPGLLKWATVGVVCASLVCELICWAIIAGLQTSPLCETMFAARTTYGVGFGLGLTAWLIELVILPCIIALV